MHEEKEWIPILDPSIDVSGERAYMVYQPNILEGACEAREPCLVDLLAIIYYTVYLQFCLSGVLMI